MLTFQEVKRNEAIRTYIQRADESLAPGLYGTQLCPCDLGGETAGYIRKRWGIPPVWWNWPRLPVSSTISIW